MAPGHQDMISIIYILISVLITEKYSIVLCYRTHLEKAQSEKVVAVGTKEANYEV